MEIANRRGHTGRIVPPSHDPARRRSPAMRARHLAPAAGSAIFARHARPSANREDRMTAPGPEDLPPLSWLSALETGIGDIDGDHRQLIDDTNLVLAELKRGGPILELAEAMRAHCREHFAREERLLAEHGFAGVEAHAVEHRRLEAELDGLIARIAEAGADARARRELGLRLRWLLLDHFLHYDLRYKSHVLHKLGL
jgi:hemerythrin